jgi:hypothetical protein
VTDDEGTVRYTEQCHPIEYSTMWAECQAEGSKQGIPQRVHVTRIRENENY